MNRPDVPSSLVASAAAASAAVALAWWRGADRGWKAVGLSSLLLAAVQVGVRILW